MGIFNEQSFNYPFARGIQGAPGVGFSLTADGNYDMTGKKLTNVGTPTARPILMQQQRSTLMIIPLDLVVRELPQD